MTDKQLCSALEGTGEVMGAFSVFCITRGGYLLLALPVDPESARKTLALYHPQSPKARALVVVVSILISLKCHRFLPKRTLQIRKMSPLATQMDTSHQIGFLLGNAEANARRAIVLHREGENSQSFVVDKIGFGEAAKQSVLDELSVIQSLPQNNIGVPRVCYHAQDDGWALYTTPYLEGRSPRKSDQEDILNLLKDWTDKGESKLFRSTQQWKELKKIAEEKKAESMLKLLNDAGELRIKVGLFHGDFAPWNIKISSKGEIDVMDWEHGSNEGPAGWDWLHYMIQQAILVDHLPVQEVLVLCRMWARSVEGKAFLADAGWGEHIEFWLISYLMYSDWLVGFDRAEMLIT